MTIDTKTMVSISDANQNFSKVARLVDECGSAAVSYTHLDVYKRQSQRRCRKSHLQIWRKCNGGGSGFSIAFIAFE